MQTFGSGAKRSERKPRYDLIPQEFLAEVAKAFQEGARKYGDGNWKLGDDNFFLDCYNHAVDHILTAQHVELAPRAKRKHLGHAAAMLAMLVWRQNANQRRNDPEV